MSRAPARPIAALLAAAVLLCAAVSLQAARDRLVPQPTASDDVLLTARAADRLIFAFRPLAADLYWIRAIQYYGRHVQEYQALATAQAPSDSAPPHGFERLYPLLDITTTLDPHFNIAYRFGAIFLSEAYPNGANRPDQAVVLLEKAVKAMPDRWQYLEDIGFVYYWDVHDYVTAAKYFNAAADKPDAPWWLRSLAATMLAKGGERQASRLLWRHMYETATDEHARHAAMLRLRQFDALDQIDALQRVVDGYERATSLVPTSWQPLVAAGRLRGVPLDPAGTPYDLATDGTVVLSTRSPLFPLPIEPAPREQGGGEAR